MSRTCLPASELPAFRGFIPSSAARVALTTAEASAFLVQMAKDRGFGTELVVTFFTHQHAMAVRDPTRSSKGVVYDTYGGPGWKRCPRGTIEDWTLKP